MSMETKMEIIRYLAPDTDAFVASVQKHRKEFEDRNNIQIEIEIVESDAYYDNQITKQLNSADPTDVFMSGPVLLWEHMENGNVQDLDAFVASSSAEWDFSDFFPTLISSNRWTGKFGDQLGDGPLLEIPVNCEAYNLAFIKSTIEGFGIQPPTTWAEYFLASEQVAKTSNGQIAGFAQRGIDIWHTMYTGFATQLWSYGGSDFDLSYKCSIHLAESLEATEDFIGALRKAGPKDWTNQRWYELAVDFANGKYGFIVDSDHYVAYFEDPSMSSNVGGIEYMLPPVGPTGMRKPNLWTWSLVMNAKSPRKSNAWKFIEWASSQEFLTRAAIEGNMNPTRRSIWDSKEYKAIADRWGNFASVSRELIEDHAKVLVTPAVNYKQLATVWVDALLDTYKGKDSAKNLLTDAAKQIDNMVR
jgi:multiple sugar transport system substrate-binding protein